MPNTTRCNANFAAQPSKSVWIKMQFAFSFIEYIWNWVSVCAFDSDYFWLNSRATATIAATSAAITSGSAIAASFFVSIANPNHLSSMSQFYTVEPRISGRHRTSRAPDEQNDADKLDIVKFDLKKPFFIPTNKTIYASAFRW